MRIVPPNKAASNSRFHFMHIRTLPTVFVRRSCEFRGFV